MEHMRQYDWCNSEIDSENFLEAEDIANSCTERILQNRFYDPLLSSDDDDEEQRPAINWDVIFAKSETEVEGGKLQKEKCLFFVPGFKQQPPYPKLSALSSSQQFQMLKIVCAQNPSVLESLFFPKPGKLDYRLYEDLKTKYQTEQQEYIQWAATLWSSGHNIRALRPNPLVEAAYEAACKVRLLAVQCWPKNYQMAAQIPLQSNSVDNTCKVTPGEEFVKVNMTEIPHVQIPDYAKRLSIMRACVLPEPCNKHPSRFILPGEKSVSILPLSEVHRELCQSANSLGAQFVASESALRTLVERDTNWILPVSVCTVIGSQGEQSNIIVIDKDVVTQKEHSTLRTYRAFKHLLLQALIPQEEKARMLNYWNKVDAAPEVLPTPEPDPKSSKTTISAELTDDEDDEADEDNLVIDMDEMDLDKTSSCSNNLNIDDKSLNGDAKKQNGDATKQNGDKKDSNNASDKIKKCDKINFNGEEDENYQLKMTGDYTCTCNASALDRPPPRSYRVWDVQSVKKGERFKLLVHCSHKARAKNGEVILEPILEYQPEIGASEIALDRIRSTALSLHLRKNASAMFVRIDGVTGEVICHELVSKEILIQRHGTDLMASLYDSMQVVLEQLQALLPGRYLLKHEPGHGANALLYAASAKAGSFTLPQELQPLSEQDEAIYLKQPRNISDALLPIHKHRKTLPCAFTPYQDAVVKDHRKPPTRQRTPPRAIRWPKRRNRKRKH